MSGVADSLRWFGEAEILCLLCHEIFGVRTLFRTTTDFWSLIVLFSFRDDIN